MTEFSCLVNSLAFWMCIFLNTGVSGYCGSVPLSESWKMNCPSTPAGVLHTPCTLTGVWNDFTGPDAEHQKSDILLQTPSLPQEASSEADSRCFRDISRGRCFQSQGDDNHHNTARIGKKIEILWSIMALNTQGHMEKRTCRDELIHQSCQKRTIKGLQLMLSFSER